MLLVSVLPSFHKSIFPLSLLNDLSIQKLYLAFGEVSVESKVKCLSGELFVQLFVKLVIFQVNSLAAAPVGSLKKFSLKENLFMCFFILRAHVFSYNTFLDFSLNQDFGGSSLHDFYLIKLLSSLTFVASLGWSYDQKETLVPVEFS